MIPATISNNVPGTEFSLGCDTALNEITEVLNLNTYRKKRDWKLKPIFFLLLDL